MNNKIAAIRQEIDSLDTTIVQALSKRINCVMEIVQYKTNEEEVKGCDRVKIVLDKVKGLAKNHGGHEDTVVEIYASIIDILTRKQLEILSQRKKTCV